MGNVRRRWGVAAVAMAIATAVPGCAGTPQPETASPARSTPAAEPPPAGAAFDYQLGGAYDPPDGVTVVARDSTERPPVGIYSICYVNGFQTQPGVQWPDELVLSDDTGTPVADPDWPDELLLDSSTESNRLRIADHHADAIAGCADAGFDAVEFDNLDSFTRSGGRLTLDGTVALAGLLVELAHRHGLAAAQKNTAELADRGKRKIGFDFAVTEECDRWDECDAFTAVYGDAVLNIEYPDDLRGSMDEVCARETTPGSTVFRDRDLVPSGSPGYAYARC